MEVVRLLSYWEGNFSGAMLVSGRVHLFFSLQGSWHLWIFSFEVCRRTAFFSWQVWRKKLVTSCGGFVQTSSGGIILLERHRTSEVSNKNSSQFFETTSSTLLETNISPTSRHFWCFSPFPKGGIFVCATIARTHTLILSDTSEVYGCGGNDKACF